MRGTTYIYTKLSALLLQLQVRADPGAELNFPQRAIAIQATRTAALALDRLVFVVEELRAFCAQSNQAEIPEKQNGVVQLCVVEKTRRLMTVEAIWNSKKMHETDGSIQPQTEEPRTEAYSVARSMDLKYFLRLWQCRKNPYYRT